MILGINASRARSGGARAHLIGILSEARPQDHGITQVHVWSYPELLAMLPDAPWLRKHAPAALSGSLPSQLLWERYRLPRALKAAGCSILLNVDAGTVCSFSPAITMSRDMLSYEAGEMRRYRFGRMRVRLLLLRLIQNRSLRSAAGAIFLTRYAADVISRSCGRTRDYALIPHGVGRAFRTPQRTDTWPHDGSRPVECLYVSPIWHFKHQWSTVKAIELLRNKGHNVVLTLAGEADPDAMEMLRQQIAVSDPDGSFVRMLGKVSHDALPGLLARADVYVFASSCENMPNTVLEGMAAGLPIACSDRGPMPEVLQDGGVYFDPEDPPSIATAIEKLLTNAELRHNVAARARELSQAYSWTRCASETLSFAAETWRRHRINT